MIMHILFLFHDVPLKRLYKEMLTRRGELTMPWQHESEPNVDIPVLFWHEQIVVLIFLYSEGNIKLWFNSADFEWLNHYLMLCLPCVSYFQDSLNTWKTLWYQHNQCAFNDDHFAHDHAHSILFRERAAQTPVQTCSSNACTNRCSSEEENRSPARWARTTCWHPCPLLTQADSLFDSEGKIKLWHVWVSVTKCHTLFCVSRITRTRPL